jgi:homoaconitase/3-isopropylmalate dehydratase large subunit
MFIQKRQRSQDKSSSLNFRPDEDAQYTGVYEIDLGKVQPLLTKHPNLDNVVPVLGMQRKPLTGYFIGGCATTEEDLVVAALVLQLGLKADKRPLVPGKRKMVAGPMLMLQRLREKRAAPDLRKGRV